MSLISTAYKYLLIFCFTNIAFISFQIKHLCGPKSEQEAEGYSQGAVEECLKEALRAGQVMDAACRIEIVALIDEGHADIHVDPLLYKACATDLRKFCSDMQQGAGRCKINYIII